MRKLKLFLLVALCVGVGFFAGSCIESNKPAIAAATEKTMASKAVSASVQRLDGFFDFSDLAEQVKPAVVNIATTKLVSRSNNPLFDFEQLPPQIRDFFRFFGPQPGPESPELPGQQPKRKMTNSLGSGVIVAPEGYVVTNFHVVKGADEIQIVFGDEKTVAAEIVGGDEKTDVALLKIKEGGPYPYIAYGDSDKVRVGEWVLAVGNPFGLNHTFTAGIVSAKGRQIGNEITYQDFIQTDASINPGNSGGPLLNLRGELIGVNTAIFSRTGQSAGIGFAIPSNLVRFVSDQLKSKQRVDRGYLGVLIQAVDEQIAQSLGLSEARGALVTQVLPDGPAGKAGIQVGDLIVDFNGEKVKNSSDLPLKVSTTPPGQNAKVGILRDGKRYEFTVKLAALPQQTAQGGSAKNAETTDTPKNEAILGMLLRPLTVDERKASGIEEGGLLVTGIQPDAPVIEAGIRNGDILLKAGNEQLITTDHLSRAIAAARKQNKPAILLLVNSSGQNRFVGIPLK